MSKVSRIQSIAIAIAMAIAVAVPIAIAQSKDKTEHAHAGRGHWGGGEMMGFRSLDLTDAQKAQLKQIRESHRQNLQPTMEEIRTKRQELRQASQGGTFNEAAVAQKLAEIAPLEAKVMGEQFRIHQEMLSVLTPEQKTKLEQTRQQFKSKWAEGRANKERKSK